MQTMTIREVKQAAATAPVTAAIHAQMDRAQVKPTKSGSEFLELKLLDAHDSFILRIWGDSPAFAQVRPWPAGAFLCVEGEWTSGQYGLEPKQWHLRPLEPEEKETLLGGPPQLREKQETDYTAIAVMVDGLADPRLKALCRLFLDEYGARFRRTGGARDYHHARRGGLVEHVAQMMRSASALAEVYPGINRDLVLAGVLFHDSGKLWENCYEKEGFSMPWTEPAELMGHIPLGIELVNRLWRQLMESPLAEEWHIQSLQPAGETVRLHLLHLVASHHGEYQFGSPTLPRTPEAALLHYVDNIDAKLEMYSESYATSPLVAPNIFERRRPLTTHAVRSLPVFVQPESGDTGSDDEFPAKL
ncbi:MAG: metal dependent phosphohydrolase [Verrucomicrobiales bacterium]|nr:metal dependent phosphohydrolase [Verrucomicrobiales bacterium]